MKIKSLAVGIAIAVALALTATVAGLSLAVKAKNGEIRRLEAEVAAVKSEAEAKIRLPPGGDGVGGVK